MLKLITLLGVCVIFTAEAVSAQTAPPVRTTSSEDSVTSKCMVMKSATYFKKTDLAVTLAQRIALECAELLPQHAENCPNNQAACDQIVQETNVQMTRLMEKYAYRMIVELRQKNAPDQ